MKEKGHITKIVPEERKSTFKEVSCGFNESETLKEADRCLQCKHSPCNEGCPAGIDVREFIQLIRNKDYQGSIDKIKEANALPGVCGRVCPQEEQCQLTCVLNKPGNPIQIGYLERFVADWELIKGKVHTQHQPTKQDKVAIIGAGPAGMSCAADLARDGYDVHLFEALHKTGGVLTYGIPEFRLPKVIVEKETEYIHSLGVKINTDFVVGRTQTIEDLRAQGFKAFYIAVGAGLPWFLGVPGENLNGVYSANEFLTRVNLMKSYRFPEYDTPVDVGKKVAVFGGGNVAFDCARSALRLGVEQSSIVYRRTRQEMPARNEEIENAQEEGIHFELLVTPLEVVSDGKGNVGGVKCLRNQLGEPDASGRCRPVPIEGSEFVLEVDTVIIAIGTSANPLLISTLTGVNLNKRGYIVVDDNYQTSVKDIFAGGDIVSGSATVISAIQQARQAAEGIRKYLKTLV